MVILAPYLNTEQRIILTICQDFTPQTDLDFRVSYLSVDDNRENAMMKMNLSIIEFLVLWLPPDDLEDKSHWIT